LATKFVIIILGIAALGFLNGLIAFVFTRSVAGSLRSAVIDNFPSVKAAEELEIALSDQRGIVSAYIVSGGNPSWLERSRKAEIEFRTWFSLARATAHTTEETSILDRLEEVHAEFDTKRKKAILQFDQSRRDEAISTLLHEVWPAYDKAYKVCEEFIDANERYVEASTKGAEQHVAFATWGVLVGSLGTAGLAALLLWLVVRGVLIPLRRMAADAHAVVGHAPGATIEAADDELRSIGVYFRALMASVAESRTTLAESRNRLLNAEKLASVGKLAASVAHEIRNPLSSMKMWLYSIRKTAGVEPSLDRKYQIIADEIARLESIVRNILEFSRPPLLKLQPRSIVQVIEKTLEIARPWLETKKIRVAEYHAPGLPPVMADSEQLKQVFFNLLDNAAGAMPEGGEISISSVVETDADDSANILVRVRDTGHGIPADVRSRLFEPFFTTKEQGTGLGLCIAANILAEHGGQLVLESSTDRGTTFRVRVPAATEKDDEQDSRC
jgi:signal transduction histidine kinase